MDYYGMDLDHESRCCHYHGPKDIAALKCQACQKYYACYQCHDSLEDHSFSPSGKTELFPVLCGSCKSQLSLEAYEGGYCPYCNKAFNPKCAFHKAIYFKKE
ncbi:CHY zinc finger protein [Streptococcus porcinus]|uniref:CHY zinc finger n=1 Tax=Streptococcus porcinus str. Jelinkova 176 TaxID=873448 RepID=A0ABN0CWH3_STRPO|nr:CHY zinc finger protein [Streptococcus porcinus]EGJ27603.1 CHY zinc finger [Streptococcus porcinus str. Jelinkova 176]SQG48607.1 CHY zinc finger protein [Streptococcus porcinus]